VAGYICPTLLLDEGDIRNVAVSPGHRGKGIGQLLVEKVLSECTAREASLVRLEVRASNSVAVTLYKKLGFTETGLRKKYYENGEDAILMDCFLDHTGDH
jgi:ribosomal-protein-alanine N-acetyltransferase